MPDTFVSEWAFHPFCRTNHKVEMSKTDEPQSFGEAAVASLRDGKRRRERGEKLTMRTVARKPPAPKDYSLACIADVRRKLNVSQEVFATWCSAAS